MALPLIPISVAAARAIVQYAGKEGAEAAARKFAQKYGSRVVERAQHKIQQLAKDMTLKSKSARKQIKETSDVNKAAKHGARLRKGQETKNHPKQGRLEEPKPEAPLEFGKGGSANSNRKRKSPEGFKGIF